MAFALSIDPHPAVSCAQVAVERLVQLAAKTLVQACRFRPPGGALRFLVRPTGGFYASIGVTLFVDHAVLRRAAIHALQADVNALFGFAVRDVSSLLLKALERDFAAFLDRWLRAHRENATLEDISGEADIERLAGAIVSETGSVATQKWWLIVAKDLHLEKSLLGSLHIVLQGGEGGHELKLALSDETVDPAFFPPTRADLRRQPVTSKDAWLGVRATTEVQAVARISQLLGAVSMGLVLPGSRMFSGAARAEGLFSLSADGRWSLSGRGPTFPPILNGARLSGSSLDWVGRLLEDSGREPGHDLRIRTCLDYVEAGWVPESRLGFLHNSIAFDALFGEDGKVTKSIVTGVTKHAPNIDKIEDRIRALLRMRNALVHGDAASVELTPDYLGYWDMYDSDPHADQVRILHCCLQRLVL